MPKGQKRLVAVLLVVSLFAAACLLCGGLTFWLIRRGSFDPARFGEPLSPSRNALRIFGDFPTTLDPALVQDVTSAAYVVEIYSGLVTLDAELEVTPDLANAWDISSDGRTYTFHIREGARFHNGKAVTAEAIKFALERACSPQLDSPVALSYLGDITGVAQVIEGDSQQISGIRVIDDLTLEITIDGPKAYFLSKLTYPVAFVVDSEDGRGGGSGFPVGTGPFVLSQMDRDAIELERNAEFYGEQAKLDRVSFVLRGGLPITMYETGQLNIAQVGLADIERVRDPASVLHDELVVVPSLDVQYVGFNVRMPPFDDANVRRAFLRATDTARLTEVVLKGTAVPARGIIPPGISAHDPTFQGLPYDPGAARQLIGESRYGSVENLPPITLHISGDVAGLPKSLEALLAIWQESLGVAVDVEAVEWAGFLDELDDRQYPMFFLGWVADYPDAHNFADMLFHSHSIENHTGYASPDVDALLDRARQEQDEGRRDEIYRQVERRVIEDAVWVPLWHDQDYYVVKPYVKGVSFSSAVAPWLQDVYIERN